MAITVTAGSRLTSAVYNTNVPAYYVQASDQSLTTSTAAWNVGAISFAASGVYACELYLDYGNFSTATNNVQLIWGSTGGATLGRLMTTGVAGGSGSTTDTNGGFQSRAATTGSVSFSGTVSTTVRGCAQERFLLTTTTAGTATLTLNMSAGTGTAYTGSYLVVHRLS